jgi:hypothetical protein
MITGKPGLLFSKTHPLREELFGQTQTFIDEWIAVGLVIPFNSSEGQVLFFPGFAKNNKLPHYERERPSRFPPPPGYARGELGLYPAHKQPPAKTPKKPKWEPAALSEDSQSAPEYIVGTPYFGLDKEMDEVMDEVQELLQDKVMDGIQDEVQESVPFLGAEEQTEVEVKSQVKTVVEVKNDDDSVLRVLAREESTFVGVVGIDDLLLRWNDEQVMAFLTWCWLYNGWNQKDVIDQQTFRDRYKREPFKGMNDCVAVMINLAGKKIMAPLAERHQDALIAALQEATP